MGFPDDSVVNNPSVNLGDSGDTGPITGSRRSPGVGNVNPLEDRGAWWIIVQGIAESDRT